MITFMQSKLNSRGQITIPIALRRKHGWSAHTRLMLCDQGDQIVVMTLAEHVHSLRGVLKGGKGMRLLREDRAHEAEL